MHRVLFTILMLSVMGTVVADEKVAVMTMRVVGDPEVNAFMVDSDHQLAKGSVKVILSRGMIPSDKLEQLTPAGIRLSNSLQRVNGFVSIWWRTKDMFHIRLGRAFDWDEMRPLIQAVIKQSCSGVVIKIPPEAKEEVMILVEGEIGSRKRTFHFDDRISTSHGMVLRPSDPPRRYDTLTADERQLVQALIEIKGVTALTLNPYSFSLELAQSANAKRIEQCVQDVMLERYDRLLVGHIE